MSELPVIWPMNAVYNPKKIDILMSNDRYVGQEKLDGVRGLLFITEDGIRITSRGESKHDKGKPIEKTDVLPHLAGIKISNLIGTVLDCELLNPDRPMQLVAGAINSKEVIDIGIKAYIFDVLMVNGRSVMDTTLENRITILGGLMRHVVSNENLIHVPYVYGTEAKQELLQRVMERGGEGIMLKNLDAVYEQGKRHEGYWYKVKKHDTWDVVIMGYTESTKDYTGKELDSWPYWYDSERNTLVDLNMNPTRSKQTMTPVTKYFFMDYIGAIRFGMYVNGELVELGQTSGMSEDVRWELSENGSKYIGTVMEVEAMEQLPSGAFRHPRFIRFRDDKRPAECVWEKEES